MTGKMVKARDLQIGDAIDLEGDAYADTDKTNEATRMSFEFELCEVIEPVENETAACVVIHTDKGSFGFPPDHELRKGN